MVRPLPIIKRMELPDTTNDVGITPSS